MAASNQDSALHVELATDNYYLISTKAVVNVLGMFFHFVEIYECSMIILVKTVSKYFSDNVLISSGNDVPPQRCTPSPRTTRY